MRGFTAVLTVLVDAGSMQLTKPTPLPLPPISPPLQGNPATFIQPVQFRQSAAEIRAMLQAARAPEVQGERGTAAGGAAGGDDGGSMMAVG